MTKDIGQTTIDDVLQWARSVDLRALSPQQAADAVAVAGELLRQVKRDTARPILRWAIGVVVLGLEEYRERLARMGEEHDAD